MSSFHEVQEQLLLSYEDGILDEDEFLLLHEQFMPKNPNFSYEEYDRFSLDEMNDAECLAEFRFRKHDLQILSEVLQIPDSFRCYQRSVVDGMEGLCILLRRLSYPCRYSDMISRFGLPVPVLSMVSNDVLDFIYNTHRHRITQWNHNVLIQLHYRFTVTLFPTKELLYIIVLGSLMGPFDPYADQESTKESSTTAIRGFTL